MVLRHWKLATLGMLLVAIAFMKLSLANEQRRSAGLRRQLSEAAAAFDRFKSDVATRTTIARAQDEAHARRVERDQVTINQETVSAYQKQIATLRARAAAQRMRDGPPATDPSRGREPNLPGVPDAAVRTDGAPGEVRLPADDALIASEIALRLKALQDWVKAQEAVQR